MGSGSGIVTAVAQVAAVVWVQSLAQEFLYAVGTTKKKKKKKKKVLMVDLSSDLNGISYYFFAVSLGLLDVFLCFIELPS